MMKGEVEATTLTQQARALSGLGGWCKAPGTNHLEPSVFYICIGYCCSLTPVANDPRADMTIADGGCYRREIFYYV